MWQSHDWVAMLDPVELSHHVDLLDLRATSPGGRETWWAVARPVEGYEPRCGCCPLVFSEISERDEHGDGWVPSVDTGYPSSYDVALDVGTGVVVSAQVRGHDRRRWGFEVEIHAAT